MSNLHAAVMYALQLAFEWEGLDPEKPEATGLVAALRTNECLRDFVNLALQHRDRRAELVAQVRMADSVDDLVTLVNAYAADRKNGVPEEDAIAKAAKGIRDVAEQWGLDALATAPEAVVRDTLRRRGQRDKTSLRERITARVAPLVGVRATTLTSIARLLERDDKEQPGAIKTQEQALLLGLDAAPGSNYLLEYVAHIFGASGDDRTGIPEAPTATTTARPSR